MAEIIVLENIPIKNNNPQPSTVKEEIATRGCNGRYCGSIGNYWWIIVLSFRKEKQMDNVWGK